MGFSEIGPKGLPSGILKKNYGSSFARASYLNARTTEPRVIWCTHSEYMTSDTSTSSTNQFTGGVSTPRFAGGRWLAIAPVYIGAAISTNNSPVGALLTTSRADLCCTLEAVGPTGAAQSGWDASRPDSTYVPINFNGTRDAKFGGGDFIVGDLVYASDVSGVGSYWEFDDPNDFPRIRTAVGKASATDILPALTLTEYNKPSWARALTGVDYATVKSVIDTANMSNAAWNSDQTIISPIGFVGIPLSGQKSFMFLGTSICDGDGDGSGLQGGVNPANNTYRNYDLIGWPNRFGQRADVNIPVLNMAVGASALAKLWGNGTTANWANTELIELQKRLILKLAQYFDYFIGYDVHNDPVGEFPDALQNFTSELRAANPGIKIYGCRVPNGGLQQNGSTTAYNSASLDPKWTLLDAMVTNGYWDGMLTVRESGDDKYPTLADLATFTATGGSTTTIDLSTATWFRNEFGSAYVTVDGETRTITSNTRTSITVNSAFSASTSGKAVTILGNCTYDATHPSVRGHKRMAELFRAQVVANMPDVPMFTSTY